MCRFDHTMTLGGFKFIEEHTCSRENDQQQNQNSDEPSGVFPTWNFFFEKFVPDSVKLGC